VRGSGVIDPVLPDSYSQAIPALREEAAVLIAGLVFPV
jgi:hypothetical protein